MDMWERRAQLAEASENRRREAFQRLNPPEEVEVPRGKYSCEARQERFVETHRLSDIEIEMMIKEMVNLKKEIKTSTCSKSRTLAIYRRAYDMVDRLDDYVVPEDEEEFLYWIFAYIKRVGQKRGVVALV